MRWFQTLFAVAAAVAPLLGVFLWGWSEQEVVLIYWAENVVIGFWQVVKMGVAGAGKAIEEGAGTLRKLLFLIPFFTLHYGGFCAGHGSFILTMTGGGSAQVMNNLNPALGPFVFLQLLFGVVQQVFAVLPRESLWSILSIFSLRGLAIWQDFVATGEWRRTRPEKLMMEPYRHIFVLHIAIIAGAALVMAFEGAWPLLAIIVLGKLGLDLFQIWSGKESSDRPRENFDES